jgi:hypothetical protein
MLKPRPVLCPGFCFYEYLSFPVIPPPCITRIVTGVLMVNPACFTNTLSVATRKRLQWSTDPSLQNKEKNKTGNYIPNGLNQYTHINGQPIGYDTNANLTNDGSTLYTYDMENRLVASSGAVTSAFKYDPLGRLHQATINNVATQFLYDGDALIAEYNSAGTHTRR